jgi:hemerythrin-like domain-containing protein
MRDDRRTLLLSTAAGVLLVGCAGASKSHGHPSEQGDEHEEEVTPAEDLMREHGILRRVMYLYDDAALRLDGKREVPLDALGGGAAIIRRVIEDYHERLEEDVLFPLFEKAGKLTELTAVLRRQHRAGRTLTEQIVAVAKAPLADADRAKLAGLLRSFNHMYRPHASREDTILFPAIRELVGAKAYVELGEQFEDKEHSVLGDHGFERAVEEVAKLEAAFGIDDLAALTA